MKSGVGYLPGSSSGWKNNWLGTTKSAKSQSVGLRTRQQPRSFPLNAHLTNRLWPKRTRSGSLHCQSNVRNRSGALKAQEPRPHESTTSHNNRERLFSSLCVCTKKNGPRLPAGPVSSGVLLIHPLCGGAFSSGGDAGPDQRGPAPSVPALQAQEHPELQSWCRFGT